ncbi:carbohydrate-selective porin, OprB family/SLH domain protein [Rubidibacter lacunae KORDI 51-2]|uniref:Carbohydrate-selective porin, OprB family/SLH domain protein n=1 Tax=Rubidibacter lacunae KORDI 51-2 TaxID=582515 RepID=U5DGC0_9CHRO|nr:iron uptake porin [Rubidibacter lacunae]ERN40626.1 carbohydrate-selective porin, OprB family/SLH domain protein [Rubidibacter lacunae KORDI 51-2]
MSKAFWNIFKAAPAVVGASLLAANGAMASEAVAQSNSDVLDQINTYGQGGASVDQINSVFQLSDVSPGDWEFEALRSLVERYGCIVGYPDGTFRRNQALKRSEFAAGLNACLQQIERLIAAQTADFLRKEDLEALQRLMAEFEAELAALGTRVDGLEARVTFLEEHQFSTTTKLNGEVLFVLAEAFGDFADGSGDNADDTQATIGYRVRLNFDTSFTGTDRLRTRLEAREVDGTDAGDTGTDMTRLNLRGSTGDNNIELNLLAYRFPVGDNLTFHVAPVGYDIDDVFDPNNPLASSGGGALARFFDRNPLTLRSAAADVGFGANFDVNDDIRIDVGYWTDEGRDPDEGAGLFDGNYSAGVQGSVDLGSEDRATISLNYVRKYFGEGDTNISSSTGSELSTEPFGDAATTSDNFGLQFSFDASDRLIFGGFFGYGFVNNRQDDPFGSLTGGVPISDDDSAEVITGSANISYLDLFKEGSILSLAAGVPPKVINNDAGELEENDGTSILVEAAYRFPVNDNIELTPGAYVVINPEHNSDNDPIVVGVVRTRFRF